MKIAISEDVIWRELGGEIVVLDLATNHYFGFSGAGSDIWRLIAEHGASDRVLEELKALYNDADPAVLRNDFDKMVSDLTTKGMLIVTPDESV